MKQKLEGHKGITLIALIITIIVLLILAVVAINAIKGDGIIAHAKNARDTYEQKSKEENEILQDYLEQINKEVNDGETGTKALKDNLNKELSTTANTPLIDDFENKITIPAGFKILVDSTTGYTADDIDVTKGIVVEDGEGNQFVWIPVGTIYTDTEKTEANAKTITLGRYSNFTKTNNAYTVVQDANSYGTQIKLNGNFTEDTTENHSSGYYKNSIAKNIKEFCTKALASGGYYIGRYEARVGTTERKSKTDTLTSVTSKANDYVYNYVTQPQASERCQSMYTNKPYESDLVNSYAWDTAIIFIQEFGDNSTYASKTSVNSSLANAGTSGTSYTGTTKDVICNVYDMASNCLEWSTETSGNSDYPCTIRGGRFNYSISYASYRSGGDTTMAGANYSFRPVLYM